MTIRRLEVISFASVPVRSCDGRILGVLTIFACQPRRRMAADELRMLESLADMVASQLELRRLRKALDGHRSRHTARRRFHNGNLAAQVGPAARPGQAAVCALLPAGGRAVTRRIVGLEALIRWQHPERGLIPPMDFIPLAEESGLILPIGDWGLSEACNQIQKWCREDPATGSRLRVCVNLSARQFSREGLADHVEALLRQIRHFEPAAWPGDDRVQPDSRRGTALEVLGSLRRLGVSLLMDDFGTGYSSLHHLHSLPFDVLKIDRSFVGRMTEGDQPLQIVRTIIELARVLGMDVVAEGIETREQYNLLRQLGCRYGQGFLFARPAPAETIGHMLRLPGRILPDPGVADRVSN